MSAFANAVFAQIDPTTNPAGSALNRISPLEYAVAKNAPTTHGGVVLRLVVMPDGRAANISVVKGVGVGLDERAVEVVQTWRFRPAKEPGGKVVPVWITVEVTFRLL